MQASLSPSLSSSLAAMLCTVSLLMAGACGDDVRVFDSGGPPIDAPGMDVSVPTDARPLRAVPFRIMNWNVENFFDNRNDPDRGDEVPNGAAVAQKIDDISVVIRAANPDFIALQEVENLPLLQRLVDEGLSDMGYDHVGLMDSFDGRGIDVGFISRFEVTNVVSHLGESFEGPTGESQFFTRDALEVFVNADGIDVLIMVSHFISQLDGNDVRREGESAQARDLLGRRANTRDHVLFAGDMNDTPDSATYAAMTMGDAILDLTLTVPLAERWTFVFRGNEQQLDYLMGTQRAADDMVDLTIIRGADVERTSDHYPIVANFVLTP